MSMATHVGVQRDRACCSRSAEPAGIIAGRDDRTDRRRSAGRRRHRRHDDRDGSDAVDDECASAVATVDAPPAPDEDERVRRRGRATDRRRVGRRPGGARAVVRPGARAPDRAPARRVGAAAVADRAASSRSPSPACRCIVTTVRDDERRPPQPAERERRPRLRPQHADRRRHGRPRLGAGLPARQPAAELAAHRAGAWTGTRACRCTASTWSCRRWRSSPSTRSCPTAWRSSWSPSPGLVTLPFCCWAFGRLARFRYPLPELFAFAGLCFALDESFSIYGGNLKSTMAGEFSFSIALSLMILGFGLLVRSMETGRAPHAGRRSCWRWPSSATASSPSTRSSARRSSCSSSCSAGTPRSASCYGLSIGGRRRPAVGVVDRPVRRQPPVHDGHEVRAPARTGRTTRSSTCSSR